MTMIKHQVYPVNNLLLTKEVVTSYIQYFWNDVFSNLKSNKHLMVLVKVY